MSRFIISCLAVFLNLSLLIKNCIAQIPGDSQYIQRVSIGTNNIQANESSGIAKASNDGTIIAFSTVSSNLVPNDTNGESDVFIHERSTGITTRISLTQSGDQRDDYSYLNSISGDGRYLTYYTRRYLNNQEEHRQLILLDRVSAVQTILCDSHDLLNPSLCSGGSFSSDGNLFVYHDFINQSRLRRAHSYNTQTGIKSIVNIHQDNEEGTYPFSNLKLSGNGRFLAFVSDAPDLVSGDTNKDSDVFVKDLVSGEITRVNVDSNGLQSLKFFSDTDDLDISFDGRYVVFDSLAGNLVSGDNNGKKDIFLHDREKGETTLITLTIDGKPSNDNSFRPSISADGRYITYISYANNLAKEDYNNDVDGFIHDRLEGTTNKLTYTKSGSSSAEILEDGRHVLFSSNAPDLVPNDTNGRLDVFIARNEPAHDFCPNDPDKMFPGICGCGLLDDDKDNDGILDCKSRCATYQIDNVNESKLGQIGNSGASDAFAISDDGNYVAFLSEATNMTSTNQSGLFFKDLSTRDVIFISNHNISLLSSNLSMTADGRYVFYKGYAQDHAKIFQFDSQTKENTEIIISNPTDSMPIRVNQMHVSRDGRFIAFSTIGQVQLPGESASDGILLYDRETGSLKRVYAGFNLSAIQISPNGQFVSFLQTTPDPISSQDFESLYLYNSLTDQIRQIDDNITWTRELVSPITTNGEMVFFDTLKIYVYSWEADTKTLISKSASGIVSGGAYFPSITSNGRFITFTTYSNIFDPEHTSSTLDIYLLDRSTGVTRRVTHPGNCEQSNGDNRFSRASEDGRYVFFSSNATNFDKRISSPMRSLFRILADPNQDTCPSDNSKTKPGVCGCGLSDELDSDQDGSLDCFDRCQDDPAKEFAGSCGCGFADSDLDNDGELDCKEDALPSQIAKPRVSKMKKKIVVKLQTFENATYTIKFVGKVKGKKGNKVKTKTLTKITQSDTFTMKMPAKGTWSVSYSVSVADFYSNQVSRESQATKFKIK